MTRRGSLVELFNVGPLAQLLREDDSEAHGEGASGSSLDAQVDRYLVEYETSAKKRDGGGETTQAEALDWRDLLKGRILSEAADDDDEDGDSSDPPAAPPKEPKKLGLDTLDVERFGINVARLIQNYDSLLEVRSTLLRRARNFLKENYDDDVLKHFDDVMRDDHGMEPGLSPADVDIDEFRPPPADRSNGSGGSGASGGP